MTPYPSAGLEISPDPDAFADMLRSLVAGNWMVNNGYDRRMAIEVISSGRADLVSFGRHFISNSDLVTWLQDGTSLHALMDQATFYRGGAHGYFDTLDKRERFAAPAAKTFP